MTETEEEFVARAIAKATCPGPIPSMPCTDSCDCWRSAGLALTAVREWEGRQKPNETLIAWAARTKLDLSPPEGDIRVGKLRSDCDDTTEKMTEVLDFFPGTMGCHEALHMSSFIASAIDENILNHPAIIRVPEWRALAQTAFDAMAELYKKIGAAHL